jgi:N-acetylneuraminic acid mutarotase
MRKVTSYLFLTGSALFLLYACTKTGSSSSIEGNWINRFDFDGVGRTNGVSFVIGDIAYVTTGYGGSGNVGTNSDRLTDTWKYTVDNNSWTKLASLPDSAARSNATGFATSTKGYVVGGLAQDGITRMKDTWEYDPTGNTWTKRADFAGTARYDAVGFGISNIGYIATGFDGNYLKDFYSFTPPTTANPNGVWAQLQSFQGSKRRGAAVFVYSGKAYVMGGQDNTTYPSDFWVFDPAGGWTAKGAIANVLSDSKDDSYTGITRVNGTAFVMGTKGYLATGAAGSLYKTVWEYDFSTDTWSQKTDFEGGARTGALSFTVKSRGYLLTGTSSTLYYSDFWEFHPDEAYNQYD